jgi:hypothetical protein
MKTYLWLPTAALTFLAAPALACEGGRGEKYAEARSAALAEADADGDGALSAAEYPAFKEALHRKKAEAHFARLDKDDDGLVTAEELENAGTKHKKPRF